MNHDKFLTGDQALRQAKRALRRGNKSQVHLWASIAARLSPKSEIPWLILAAIGEPHASVVYANQALLLNPDSKQASKALSWALLRQKENNFPYFPSPPPLEDTQRVVLTQKSHPYRFKTIIPWIILIVILCGVLLTASFVPAGWVLANNLTAYNLIIISPQPSLTWTSTPTLTTAFPTPTITASPSNTPIGTSTPSFTPMPLPTDTLSPTLRLPTELPITYQYLPVNINTDEHWIDVDLSKQELYAYAGDQRVNTFTVSTGTWDHPTVTGQYRIYVKYLYDDMTGPGYYLPDVPYTMYFYKGYSFHGTYWHDNFGTPMSHGCVNLRTEEAAWLFDFAYEGTLVNIHY